MPKFVLHEIEAIKGKQIFCQVEINGVKQLDTFEEELAGTSYLSEFRTMLTYMEFVANNKPLPQTKFRELKGVKDGIKEYEFKSKHLRIYAVHQKGGKIIVLCGFKNNQEKDINRFRSIKKELVKVLDIK